MNDSAGNRASAAENKREGAAEDPKSRACWWFLYMIVNTVQQRRQAEGGKFLQSLCWSGVKIQGDILFLMSGHPIGACSSRHGAKECISQRCLSY